MWHREVYALHFMLFIGTCESVAESPFRVRKDSRGYGDYLGGVAQKDQMDFLDLMAFQAEMEKR